MTAPVAPVPASPASPAPSAPTPGAAPAGPVVPKLSPVKQAVADARARATAEGSILPAGTESELDNYNATPSELDERDRLAGHFQPRVPAGVPEGGQFTADGEDGEAPAEEAPPAEGEEAGAEDATEGDPLVVQLPARDANGEPLEIKVDDPATAEALRRMSNGFVRGEDMRAKEAAWERDREERDELREQVTGDPIGFMVQHIPPDVQAETALYLITRPEIWALVSRDLHAMVSDPNKLQVAEAKLEARRYAIRDELQQRNSNRREVRQQARQISEQVRALVPAKMPADQADAMVNECLRDVAEAVNRGVLSESAAADPQGLAIALARRLALYGIDPVEAAARLAGAGKKAAAVGTAPRSTAPRTPGQPAAKAPAKRVVTASTLKAEQARKRAAGMAGPPGQVAPSAASAPLPTKVGIRGTIAALRERLKSGGSLNSITGG